MMSDFKFPCESYNGVTNLWLSFLLNRVSVAHTKPAKRSCPLCRVSSWFSMRFGEFKKSSHPDHQPESYSTTTLQIYFGHINVNIVTLKRTCFVFSKMDVNMLSSRCICMHLCSQGPHLWPFISSQVKGLRDNETHWHTMLVWNSSMWQPAVQSASSTGNVKHSSFKYNTFLSVIYVKMFVDMCYAWFLLNIL